MPKINKNDFHPNGQAKHAGGAPSKYKAEFCDALIKHFTVETYRKVLVKRTVKALREGFSTAEIIEEYEEKGGDLPFFSQFCRIIGVSTKTMLQWVEKHEEFRAAYNVAKDLQKNHLIQNGVQGNYNPAFAIFTAKNITDMKDQPTTVIDNSKHTHITKVQVDNMSEQQLLDLLLGRKVAA